MNTALHLHMASSASVTPVGSESSVFRPWEYNVPSLSLFSKEKLHSLCFHEHAHPIYFVGKDNAQIKTILELHGQISISSPFWGYVNSLPYTFFFFFERLTIVLEKGHQMMLRNVIHISISHPISFYNCNSMQCRREPGKRPYLPR